MAPTPGSCCFLLVSLSSLFLLLCLGFGHAKLPPLRPSLLDGLDSIFLPIPSAQAFRYRYSLCYEWGSHHHEPSLKTLCAAHSDSKHSPLNIILIRGLTAFASEANPSEPVLSLSYHCVTPFPQIMHPSADEIVGHQSALYNCSRLADEVAFCQANRIFLFLSVQALDSARYLASTEQGKTAAEMLFYSFLAVSSNHSYRRPFGPTVELDGIHLDCAQDGEGYLALISRLRELIDASSNTSDHAKSYYLSAGLHTAPLTVATPLSLMDLLFIKEPYSSLFSQATLDSWAAFSTASTPGLVFTEAARSLLPLSELYKAWPQGSQREARFLTESVGLFYGLHYTDPTLDHACESADDFVHTHGTRFLEILSQPKDEPSSVWHLECARLESPLISVTADDIRRIDDIFGTFEPLDVPQDKPAPEGGPSERHSMPQGGSAAVSGDSSGRDAQHSNVLTSWHTLLSLTLAALLCLS